MHYGVLSVGGCTVENCAPIPAPAGGGLVRDEVY